MAKQLPEFYSPAEVARGLSRLPSVLPIDIKDASVSLVANYLTTERAQTLYESLLQSLDFEQPRIKMFGREVLSPRLHSWHGDGDARYRWSGRVWEPKPWPDDLHQLRDQLARQLSIQFNSCLVNRYRSGDDAMGWHSDDEPELGTNPVIASISLGAVRQFELKHRGRCDPGTSTTRHRIPLTNGSLLLMWGKTQHHWKHRIGRQRNVTGERLNLTFRVIRHVRLNDS